jgi:hypothetical protein
MKVRNSLALAMLRKQLWRLQYSWRSRGTYQKSKMEIPTDWGSEKAKRRAAT